MKKWYLILICLMCLPIYAFGLISLFDVDQTVSEYEKRSLATAPDFSFESLFSGEYTMKLDEYFTDTFPMRDKLMSVNRSLNGFYHFSGGGGAVIITRPSDDGAAGGETLEPDETSPSPTTAPTPTPPVSSSPSPPESPSPSPSPELPPELDNPDKSDAVKTDKSILIIGDRAMEIPYANKKVIKRYADNLNNYAKLMPDVRVFSLIAPTANAFYAPEDYRTGSADQQKMIESLYEQLDNVISVDAYTKLRWKVDEYIYFRTDHHWTARGAYYAYTALCESAEFSAVPLEDFETGRYDTFVGTMYGWTSNYAQSAELKKNPDYVEYFLPIVEATAKYYKNGDMKNGISIPVVDEKLPAKTSNKYLCFIRGDTPICNISTNAGTGKSCVVIKESFGNALVPFLTSHYDEIYVIDPRQFNSKDKPSLDLVSFVDKHDVDDLFVINYPFMLNNPNFIALLEKLVD